MKKAASLIISLLFIAAVYAQGFKSFTVEGQLFPALIKDNSKGGARVEVIINDKVNITNIDFDYQLYSRSRVVSKISRDFSEPQEVTINKRDVGDKVWTVNIKQLIPAPLPLHLNFSKSNPSNWTPSVKGFAGIGIDTRKNTVVRFGNHDVSFIVAFDKDAQSVTYDLMPVSKELVEFAGKFIVQTSTDAKIWNTIHTFDENHNFDASNNYTHLLEKGVRYIKWTYIDRIKLNINLNNIKVIPADF